jgi:hypothetical protein
MTFRKCHAFFSNRKYRLIYIYRPANINQLFTEANMSKCKTIGGKLNIIKKSLDSAFIRPLKHKSQSELLGF